MGALPGSIDRGSAAASGPAVATAGLPREERGRDGGRRRSGKRHRSQAGRWLADTGVALSAALVVAAPLAVGGVHRPTLIALMAAAAVCVAALSAGQALQGRSLRVGVVVLVPLAFMLIPLIQSIPLPLSLRSLFDSAGTALLRENDVDAPWAWPLSLDPPATRVYVGRGAVALIVFLVAYHLASGQKRRHLLMRAVACAGLAAVVVGVGHRILAIPRLYGLFEPPNNRALITGPFVNVNHTAELLELAAFVCLACSFARETALNRVGWLVGTLVCAGAAFATLSRGAVVAMAMGVTVFAFLRYLAPDGSGVVRRRASLAWVALIVCVIGLGAAAFGAGQLVDRFRTDTVATDVRFHLWRDSLRVFAAHPFGIGRGAFDRVFPIYRAFQMPFPVRFAFVEDEPLQLLIDCGWFFFALLAGALLVLIGWRIVRHGRRDKIEAALLGGLFAVLAHGVLDFGLETLGVLVPFAAILGTVLGRLKTAERDAWSARAGWAIAAAGVAFALFGAAATAHPSNDDFDALLKQPQKPEARRALLTRAERVHPLDYYYALSTARLLPLKSPAGGPSPRLHTLNRALRLCPACETAHVEVARNLWKLGLRPQSLLEWRTAVEIQPSLFPAVQGELFVSGAQPAELAAVAATDVRHTLDLVAFLSGQDRVKDAFIVLDQAAALGAARGEILLARGGLELKTGQLDAAARSLDAAVKASVQDPMLAVLRARLLLARQGTDGADRALAILDEAAIRNPADLNVQNERVTIVVAHKRWNAAARSLDGLKLALFRNYGSATDAHVWGARIDAQLGRWNKALDEFRIALADRPTDVSLWLEYARAAEAGGRDVMAREAYGQASRLSPNSPDIASAQQALEARSARLRVLGGNAPTSGVP
jgi:tetratricopeptide (TPR) repeat protein